MLCSLCRKQHLTQETGACECQLKSLGCHPKPYLFKFVSVFYTFQLSFGPPFWKGSLDMTQSNWEVKTPSWNQGSLLHYWPQEKGQLCHLARFWLVPGFGPDLMAPAVSFPSVSVPVWCSQCGTSFMHAGAVGQISCEMLGDLTGIPRSSC